MRTSSPSSDQSSDAVKPGIGTVLAFAVHVVAMVIGIWLIESLINTDSMSYNARRMIRIAYSIATIGFLGLVFKLAILSGGPKAYRSRWIASQLGGLVGAAVFLAAGTAYWLHATSTATIGYALGMHAIPTAIAILGFYILALGTMPSQFFDGHPLGRQVFQFLGVQKGKDATQRCLVCGIGFLIVASGFSLIAASVFSSSY